MKALKSKIEKMNALVEAYRTAHANSAAACEAIVITNKEFTLPDGTVRVFEHVEGGEAWIEARKAEQVAKAKARRYAMQTAEALGLKIKRPIASGYDIQEVARSLTQQFHRAVRAMQEVSFYDSYIAPTLN